ncbi:uncharacterized protein FIBRA_00040 [Fibroporia radiculosa]|uniref:ATP-dependent DNA helicase n=1 Tax=Fibroporia radiculosa TaxID=599839 RepID=J7SBR1_9APHY|nr:uncharacterized protein FIBRA_00040 [Fibroporia radiculosa]CCL98046.1 predicted protein [Fibroporia radiculosa]
MEEVLQMSLAEYESSQAVAVEAEGSPLPMKKASKGTRKSQSVFRKVESSFKQEESSSKSLDGALATSESPGGRSARPALRDKLNEHLASLDAEIQSVEEDLKKLATLREALLDERKEVIAKLQSAQKRATISPLDDMGLDITRSAGSRIDYHTEYEWSDALRGKMKAVFGIDNFRLCQHGVCNANMDRRDIICVMPTGGGKSLTYQLPALFVSGCTLVISPLISLMNDQILHLREAGVEAVMFTSSTSKEEAREIDNRLVAMAHGRSGSDADIKLCYVTPEKIAKNKAFMPLLEKLYKARKLERFVIDEAHCVSEAGHDYRPDYQKLNVLRKVFPKVPILALSATCPPKVMQDLMDVLQMKQPLHHGDRAGVDGTVYFTAPLYRKNLHYSVLPKPMSHKEMMNAMADYIMKHHADHSGIIYCLSKKDAETVSEDLSERRIKTGVYHADIGDSQKETLHQRWRQGLVKVVCATIAFGLGIDKGDVRFVLHHTIPKSVQGLYQESGRAGRDGHDADCVLYYRPQDFTRLSQLTVQEKGSRAKIHDILRFAQTLTECRNILFAKYFSSSSQISMSSWSTEEKGALEPCGHCDNCTRGSDGFVRRDVRLPAWQILRVAEVAQQTGKRFTINQLASVARGRSSGTSSAASKGKGKEKAGMDLDEIAGGAVELSNDDVEALCVDMLINGYLKEEYHSQSYGINVYVVAGAKAVRLSRFSREDIEQGKGPEMEYCFLKKSRKKKGESIKSHKKTQATGGESLEANGLKRRRLTRSPVAIDDPYDQIFDQDDTGLYTDDIDLNPRDDKRTKVEIEVEDESEDEDFGWQMTLRGPGPPRKRLCTNTDRPVPSSSKAVLVDDEEVICITDSE